MSNTNDKFVKGLQTDSKLLDELQDQLDIEVFEQEEPDIDKVKAILDKMESCSHGKETKIADKELLWGKIMEQSREEFANEPDWGMNKSLLPKKPDIEYIRINLL